MKEHLKVLAYLEKIYGTRENIAHVFGTTAQAVYFWQYRKEIPAQFHGLILALHDGMIGAEDLIPNFERIEKISEALQVK